MLGMYYEANTWPVDTLIRGVEYIYIYTYSDQHSIGYGDSWILRLRERERERERQHHVQSWCLGHDVLDCVAAACAVGTKFKDTNVAHGQQDFSTNLIEGPPSHIHAECF
jgi:hypothetical protein